jgi:TetR/AcrR family transcriptional repressor of uid operon
VTRPAAGGPLAALLTAASVQTSLTVTDMTDAVDRTTDRILDAAVAEAATVGLNRLTVEDVVRRAGVSRMTAYRRYPRRDDLVAALILRETGRFLAAVRDGIALAASAPDGVVEAFVAAVQFSREHPMLRRAGQTDSALSTEDTATLLGIGSGFIAANLNAGGAEPEMPPPQHIRWVSDTFARLFLTYISCPPTEPDLRDDAELRRFADQILTPIVAQALGGGRLS